MAKERSPNYPQIPLTDAVELLKKFADSEGTKTAVDNATAAKAIGYGTVSGASRTKIGALKQFGLLQGRGDTISVTPLGLRIVHPDDDTDYAGALQDAARSPEVYRSLLDSHTDASDNAIVAYLVKSKGFTAEGARQLAKSFKDTLAFAKLTPGAHTTDASRDVNSGKGSGMNANSTINQNALPQNEGSVAFNVPFRGAILSVSVEVKGQPLGRAHVEKVMRYLKMVAEDFPVVAAAAPNAASLTELTDDGPEGEH